MSVTRWVDLAKGPLGSMTRPDTSLCGSGLGWDSHQTLLPDSRDYH